jgi:hypothetical protein
MQLGTEAGAEVNPAIGECLEGPAKVGMEIGKRRDPLNVMEVIAR